ncbi:hydrogenase nickel incorporation protein HypB [Proteus mirabilis]|uniref:hydrogenase nickel incorporation protein HypB n=1 Tax=Proteus mirabilis TaxID=584 RepID=UPI00066684A1|nr:hydrogenase nickel incorporation protein HypB [Proteus mirabilis]EJD6330133.1 hydrogenase nickel incorporation protein HypB [Proteus mirabilis]EJD6392294.1 hydrogenase nickel incorporation protein HypB [Proteus mirabilis]EKU8090605.1 hydrogenase nickel incorporation protein HypB [Proteus mirabilis]EKW1743281.1 hydrogenase nickel incorporation protein HypB [Proteus mirabilis]EKW4025629.1 hydrogenase nickel incorporation protein HypB [Proteus mirabilis]
MCSTCGCGEGNVSIEGVAPHSHDHHHHSHDHDHHDHGHHHHGHHHHHEHNATPANTVHKYIDKSEQKHKHNYETHGQPIIIHHHHYHNSGDVHLHFYHDAQQNEAQVFHEHHHGHDDDHHAHSHEHTHSHEHEHSHDHEHSHEHEEQFSPVIDNDNMHYGQGEAGTHAPGISQKRMLKIEMDVLDKNNRIAVHNREHFAQQNVLALNLVSSPGSGKTTLLTQTLKQLTQRVPCAVIEGDQQTTNDADRIRETGVAAIQVNTGKGCHLDAQMVHDATHQLGLKDNSILFIENVGNLVCPASFDLGEKHKVAILSVTEGEDKPLKYPHMFAAADLMIINKIDLVPHLNIDVQACIESARRVNPNIEIIALSATTGEGMEEWLAWLESRLCA